MPYAQFLNPFLALLPYSVGVVSIMLVGVAAAVTVLRQPVNRPIPVPVLVKARR